MLSVSLSQTLRRVAGRQGSRVGHLALRRSSSRRTPSRHLDLTHTTRASLLSRSYCHRSAHLVCRAQENPELGVYEELSVQDLSTILSSSSAKGYQFVDVREPTEVETSSLPLFQTFPLGSLLNGAEDALAPEKPTILLCHHGIRSRRAAAYLLEQGFARVLNVTGGIDAYAKTVDSTVPLY